MPITILQDKKKPVKLNDFYRRVYTGLRIWLSKKRLLNYQLLRINYFMASSTTAEKASGLWTARSAKTFLLIRISFFFMAPINLE